jgi:bifunctional DNase/RNase
LKELIPLRILSVNPSSVGASSYILLLEADETLEMRFPIVIGNSEAQSISVYLEQIQPSRPLTHDLCVNLISFADLIVKKVIITHFRDGIFYANIVVLKNGESHPIDARPSDAISLAIRLQVPILIAKKLLQEICIPEDEFLYEAEDQPAESPQKRSKSDLEVLLQKALSNENYEEAAKLRDEIEKL